MIIKNAFLVAVAIAAFIGAILVGVGSTPSETITGSIMDLVSTPPNALWLVDVIAMRNRYRSHKQTQRGNEWRLNSSVCRR